MEKSFFQRWTSQHS